MKPKRIAIMGASGFLGKVLVRHFNAASWEPLAFTRKPSSETGETRQFAWDPRKTDTLSKALDGIDVVVNLCGESVDCRYHRRNKKRILRSRTEPTHAIADAIRQCLQPPSVWINASSATIYEASVDTPQTECDGRLGHGFSVSVCRAWENAFFESDIPGVRKVALRTALALGRGKNSVFPRLKNLATLGFGGTIGSGSQMVSWIHEEDFARAVEFLIENEDLGGIFNVAAPAPISNRIFMETIRAKIGRRFGLPTPRWLLEIGTFFLRTESELVLKSRFAFPERLIRNRFVFRFPFIDDAVADMLKVR